MVFLWITKTTCAGNTHFFAAFRMFGNKHCVSKRDDYEMFSYNVFVAQNKNGALSCGFGIWLFDWKRFHGSQERFEVSENSGLQQTNFATNTFIYWSFQGQSSFSVGSDLERIATNLPDHMMGRCSVSPARLEPLQHYLLVGRKAQLDKCWILTFTYIDL